MGTNIRQGSRDWSRNLWDRVKALFSGLDTRVTALEQGGGGGGGGAVSGVKGDAESTYRTGNVNLTPANIGALPNTTAIPSKTSDLTNDSGFISAETDPTVPSWAKASSKPSYTASEVGAKAVQTAVSDPTASGTGLTFIDSITQDAQGVITPTKKTVQTATQSANGVMSSTDKAKLDGIASGAQVNSITGVKGNAESTYRTGNVNLTPANIGALPSSGGTVTGTLQVNNTNTTGSGVKIWEDTEGGNLSIYSPNGVWYQFDAYNNDTIRCHVVGSDNTPRSFSFNRNTGQLSASGGFNGNATSATSATSATNATNVTGTVAIANGGTGQTGTSSVVTTISSVAVANTDDGFSITEAKYAYWGKVAMVRLKVKKTGAVTSATQMTLCTIVSGKRPVVSANAMCIGLNITYSEIFTNGQLLAYGTWANGSEKIFVATYILT